MKKLFLTASLTLAAIGFAIASGHTVSVTNTQVTCFGTCNGTASATVSGGSGSYQYDWVGPMGYTGTGANIAGICAGSYTVTVTDLGDMSTATATTAVLQPMAIGVSIPYVPLICGGSCAVENPNIVGGVPGYTYEWTPAIDVSDPYALAPTICPHTSGTYTLTVTDSYGCTATGTSIIVVSTPIVSSLTPHNPTSCGACDGSITTLPSGGSPPYSYQWSNGVTTGSATLSALCASTYTLLITDGNGCTQTDSATLTAPALYPNFTVVPDSANGYGVWVFNSTAGSGLSYNWNYGDGFTSSSAAPPMHIYGGPGTYNVCVNVSSFLGCSASACQQVTITGTPATCLSLFNVGDDLSSSDPNVLTVYNLSYGSALSYMWDFGDGSTSTLQDPTHTYSGMGPYQLCLTVDNGSGCTQMYCDSIMSVDSLGRSASLSLHVEEAPAPVTTGIPEASVQTGVSVFPNPFTDNTTFVIANGKAGEVYSLEITDVIGKKVKSLYGISDKQFTVSRSDLQDGVYFYKVYTASQTVSMGKLIVK